MCFNKEVSLLAFIFGFATSVKYFIKDYETEKERNENIITGTFILTICLMQLVEFFLWMNQKHSPTNLLLSKATVLVITSQLVSFFSTSVHFKTLNRDSKLYFPTIVFFALFLIGTVAMIFTVNWNSAYTFKSNQTCRLEWGPYQTNSAVVTSVFYLIAFYLLIWENYREKGVAILTASLLAGIVYSLYYSSFNFKTFSYGSIWCFFIVVISILAGIFDFFP